MPAVSDLPGAGGVSSDPTRTTQGAPSPPPPPPVAAPTLGNTPTVSNTPRPGQGVALTLSGSLPVAAAATGIRMLSADPAAPLTGEFWYRVDTHAFCVKETGGIKRVTLS